MESTDKPVLAFGRIGKRLYISRKFHDRDWNSVHHGLPETIRALQNSCLAGALQRDTPGLDAMPVSARAPDAGALERVRLAGHGLRRRARARRSPNEARKSDAIGFRWQ